MRPWLAITVLALSLGLPLPSRALDIETVEVFTVSDRPVTGVSALAARGITVTVYRLDAITRFADALSAGLPTEPDAAKTIALSRLENLSDRRDQLALAANGLVASRGYGLDRTPAVVLDGAAVVYGVLDLEAAVAIYEHSRATP